MGLYIQPVTLQADKDWPGILKLSNFYRNLADLFLNVVIFSMDCIVDEKKPDQVLLIFECISILLLS